MKKTPDRVEKNFSVHKLCDAVRCVVETLEARRLLSANPIVAENQLPGNAASEWDVVGAGDASIQGFSTDISVNQGNTIAFKIDDKSAAPYHLDIYRMGYYGGMGARKVATIAATQTLRQVQPAPLFDVATGLVDCRNWAVSASWQIPANATSGIYFAKVVRDDTGGASHIVFVVRNDSSHSDLLFQTSDTTWEAYNSYGSESVYQGNSTVDPDDRAVKVSYNRPLIVRGTSGGLGDYNSPFHAEYPMVRWLEANGYDVSYFTDVDSDRLGSEILQHRTFLSVGHDEYWSGGQRANVEAARDRGVNLAFFSGNEIFWKTRWESDASGAAYRTLVTYKESKANAKVDPAPVWTGTWRDDRFSPPYDGGRPENALSGTAYMNDRTNVDIGIGLQVPAADGKLRFWRNTPVAQLPAGQVATIGDRIVGYETDEDLDNGFRPAGLIDMSSTTFTTNSHVLVPWGSEVGPGVSTHKLTLYRAASGALVFGAGTVQWSWGLDGQHDDGVGLPDQSIRQATVNLLADMGAQPSTLQPGLLEAVETTDTVGPSSTITSMVNGASLPAGVPVTISGTATDSGGGAVGGVEVSVDGGKSWHPANGREAWSYTWTPGTSGAITILARATDDSGNTGSPSAVGASVYYQPTNAAALVAAYDFNAGTGTTLSDVSGHGNTGTISNAIWSNSGRNGKALQFDGTSSLVTVADSNSLDLTSGMTLEAWVKPTGNTGWESVLMKERSGGLVYSMYSADSATNSPIGYVRTASGDYSVQHIGAIPLDQWTHLATTFDGSMLHFFINGSEVANQSVNGTMAASTGALRIGGDTVFGGEYFQGLIDDVRIYSRALSAGEIGSDLSTPIGGALDSTAPGVALSGPPAGSTVSGTVSLSATASDNAAVAGVQFLLNGSPIGNEVTTAPYVLAWDASGVTNGSYSLTARARDVAGNMTTSAAIGITVNNPPDVTYPIITLVAPKDANAIFGTTVLDAIASDNIRVVGVQFQVNGINLGSEVLTAPYRVAWNSSTLPSGTYTLTAIARDGAGNVTTSSPVQVTVDNSPPRVLAASPAAGATSVATSSSISVDFSKPIQVSSVSFVVRDAANNVIPGHISYFAPTNTTTFIPDVTLAPATAYTVTVSGTLDKSGLAMTAPFSWTFATKSQVTGATVFRNQTPTNTAANDQNAVEVGMKFRSDMPGIVTGVRFYKSALNAGTHIGHLWSNTGQLLGSVTFANESGDGWQQANFSTPVSIVADTTYVISYFAPQGHYAADAGGFAGHSLDNAPLHALADGSDGADGTYLYAPQGGFPTTSGAGANYWVDAVFDSILDTTPPSLISRSPAAATTGVSTASFVTATFAESVQPSTITFVLKDGNGNAVPAVLSYSSSNHVATLTPAASLAPSTQYTVSVSGAKDLSGNVMAAPDTWSFTTASTSTYSFWRNTNVPTNPSANDASAIEVGMKFRADVAGQVTGVRFYKGVGNTGIHTGSLWTSSGQLLGSVTFTNESANGWQEAVFSQPISISSGTTYVVSYSAPAGHYAADGTFFASAGVDVGPIHALSSATAGGNGVYTYGTGFPSSSYNATNYWVDVLFQQAVSDLTPPAVTASSPAAGTTNVATNGSITATFSESVQMGTISMVVKDGNGTSVAGNIVYDDASRTATFTPTTLLSQSTNYTVTVSGAADLVGNVMTAPTAWSFTTAASTQSGAGISIWTNSTLPAIASANDANPIELGMKFRTDVSGTITGIRFYKGAQNTGTHLGHLWSNTGQLLASVTFSSESASGWQLANFSSPVAINPATTYVISYYAPVGGYAVNAAYFSGSGSDNGSLHALGNGVDGANGVYRYGAGGGFPTSSYNAANYWVDVVFQPQADTTPPSIVAKSPGSAANGVAVNSSMTLTFSESIQSPTLVLLLKDGNGNIVPSSVSYNDPTRIATLTPTNVLAASTTYTVIASGAQDAAGNTMTTVSWSFTTAAAVAPSYSLWTPSATPAIASVNDPSAVELGMKFRTDVAGTVTGIRFYKGASNTGVHLGHLWSSTGQLLASVTFSGESASGWQQANFSTPVAINAGVTYVISYYAPSGGYSATGAYFATGGADSGPLHGLTSGLDGANGVYAYGTGGSFPTSSYNNTNYWVDVVFQSAAVVTGGGVWQQTSTTDFSTATLAGLLVANSSGGEVQLAPPFQDGFSGSALGSGWTSTSWTPAGGGATSINVTSGLLALAGAEVLSTQTATNATIQGQVAFGAAPYQHFGLATDFASVGGNYWAMFSTGSSANTLFARVNANGLTQDVVLGALPSGFHQYVVQQQPTGFAFLVDGVLKATVATTFPSGTLLRAGLSNFNGATVSTLQADSVLLNTGAGTLTSSVFDAGGVVAWGQASWTASLPAGTSILIETSSGNTATPDGSWSAWQAVGSNGTVLSPSARYLRYRITLLSSDPSQTPVFYDISIAWG